MKVFEKLIITTLLVFFTTGCSEEDIEELTNSDNFHEVIGDAVLKAGEALEEIEENKSSE